MICKDFQNN